MPVATAGRLVVHRLPSEILKGNPLGDPAERDLIAYLPPGYDDEPERRYPALLALVGFTGTGASLFNTNPMGEDLRRRMDRLILSGECPPVVLAAPDCFNRLGGSQYINSTATGFYEDYLVREVVPFAAKQHRTARWGVFGKSSGGYGAIVLAMRHPELFEAVADHSGDSDFELSYLREFPAALDRWRACGGPARWLERFWADPSCRGGADFSALTALAMAAHYSPNPDSPHRGADLPFDLETGEFKPKVWERWRLWDPVRMVLRYTDNLKRLRLIYVDCGTKDEFALHWGARALVAELRRIGCSPHHEEFDGGHRGIDYRYDRSLPLLAKALAGGRDAG